MTAPRIELADIVRRYGPSFLDDYATSLPFDQIRTLTDIAECRTAALGGHVEACPSCGFEQISYNSCRNRHCPKCQGSNAAKWAAAREADLLPVSYFHLVFTLPGAVAPVALQNKRVVYDMLFQAASRTLLQIAADEKHLGARIGFLAVLHTWGQNLHHHPHLHCLVPGGGIALDGASWVPSRHNFFLPVRVLSPVFRGKFVELLRRAYDRGQLELHGRLASLTDPTAFDCWLDNLAQQDWVVYAKPPFGGAQQVVRYLARYTHRVAISNHRLVSMDDATVAFRWRDYAAGGAKKIMHLRAHEFLRRFLQHTLPKGYRRIRYYGFMATRLRTLALELCRTLLGAEHTVSSDHDAADSQDQHRRTCPKCGVSLVFLRQLQPVHTLAQLPTNTPSPIRSGPVPVYDTS